MRIAEAARLVLPGRRSADLRGLSRALTNCHTIAQLRQAARRRLPRAVFDYIDGGADDERTLRESTRWWADARWQPTSLTDVGDVDLTTEVWDQRWALPFGLAPTGYSLLAHPDGERGAAAAAARAHVPYTLSNVANTSVESVASAAGHGQEPGLWAQLYLCRDRDVSWRYLDRAWKAGSRTLLMSLDTAVSGNRVRDLTNGLTIPPHVSARVLLDVLARPAYWSGVLSGPSFGFPNIAGNESTVTIASMTSIFDASMTWADFAEVRTRWRGRLLVKGPVSPSDAKTALDTGADGIYLSAHGGRQLDRAIPMPRLLRSVRAALGPDATIICDTGIRSGLDVLEAIADGASAVMIGRAYLYGLAVAGKQGVDWAIALLASELKRSLQLLGARSVAEIHAEPSRFLAA